MKKIYFLCFLFSMSFAAKAQTTTTIWASGASGTYTTGSAFENLTTPVTYSRNDGIIAVTKSSTQIQTGYAIFDLSTIPQGAVVSQVILGVYCSGFTGAPGTFGTCATYGNLNNFSTGTYAIAPYSTLFNACQGAGGTLLWSAATTTVAGSYGTYVGNVTMTGITGSPVCNFIQTARPALPATPINNVSISFNVTTGTTSFVYNFTGETGALATAGLYAPYLTITYCFNPTGVTATASPNPICVGQPLTLTGTASGASSYTWTGPAGYTSTALSPTFTVTTTASAGVYTLTANTLCGTFTQTVTTAVTVNASPAAIITPTTTVCQGNVIIMSDATHGGVWSSSNTTAATIDALGNVTGVNTGTSLISYTLGLCPATVNVTVNDPPGPISGPTTVCANGGTITLVDGVSGGTWSSSNTIVASVDPISGLVTGGATPGGAVTISYFTGACNPPVTYAITVNPLPAAITGPSAVCVNAAISLSDATPAGVWSSNNTSLATVVSGPGNTGVVTGISASPVIITYTLSATTCYITTSVTVNPIPALVSGPNAVCVGLSVVLSDATGGGGTWSSSSTPVATVGSVTGSVTGVSASGVNITYTLPVTGCFIVDPFTVNPLPNAITGPAKVCVKASITLSDATPGGAWSSQLTSVATANPVSGAVTGVASGVSQITYTLAATNCTATFAVTVNPLPLNVITPTGPTTFCAGGNVTLDATVAGGDTYQWFANGTAIGPPLGTANTYTANTTELLTVQITDANGCIDTSAGAQVTLVQAALITAGGPIVFCQPGNVLLSVPLAPGILYQWYLNGASIPGANMNTYYAFQNGTYTCTLNVPGGCASITPAFTITVHAEPIPVITYSGGQLTTTNGFVNYEWFLNSVQITGDNTNSATPSVNGSYMVRVVDGNGCVGAATYVINDLAVQQINKTDIKIYPNPAHSMVYIESPVTVRAVITDVEGKILVEVPDAKNINISSLADGIYMIMLYDSNGDRLVVQKLVKE